MFQSNQIPHCRYCKNRRPRLFQVRTMPVNIQDAKSRLRKRIRALLSEMPVAQREAAADRARALLAAQAAWRKAQSILFYAPQPEELDLWPLVNDALAAGKTVALPRFEAGTNQYVACRIENLAREIQRGKFGIREPNEACAIIPLDRVDLVLAPGVAFDSRGRRLGRGRGFYDRLLALARGAVCGVAFDEQIVAEIPVEPHDTRVNCILTPKQWIEV